MDSLKGVAGSIGDVLANIVLVCAEAVSCCLPPSHRVILRSHVLLPAASHLSSRTSRVSLLLAAGSHLPPYPPHLPQYPPRVRRGCSAGSHAAQRHGDGPGRPRHRSPTSMTNTLLSPSRPPLSLPLPRRTCSTRRTLTSRPPLTGHPCNQAECLLDDGEGHPLLRHRQEPRHHRRGAHTAHRAPHLSTQPSHSPNRQDPRHHRRGAPVPHDPPAQINTRILHAVSSPLRARAQRTAARVAPRLCLPTMAGRRRRWRVRHLHRRGPVAGRAPQPARDRRQSDDPTHMEGDAIPAHAHGAQPDLPRCRQRHRAAQARQCALPARRVSPDLVR
jgi:hypothetical protein